jgi:hypothetical protein
VLAQPARAGLESLDSDSASAPREDRTEHAVGLSPCLRHATPCGGPRWRWRLEPAERVRHVHGRPAEGDVRVARAADRRAAGGRLHGPVRGGRARPRSAAAAEPLRAALARDRQGAADRAAVARRHGARRGHGRMELHRAARARAPRAGRAGDRADPARGDRRLGAVAERAGPRPPHAAPARRLAADADPRRKLRAHHRRARRRPRARADHGRRRAGRAGDGRRSGGPDSRLRRHLRPVAVDRAAGAHDRHVRVRLARRAAMDVPVRAASDAGVPHPRQRRLGGDALRAALRGELRARRRRLLRDHRRPAPAARAADAARCQHAAAARALVGRCTGRCG